MIYVQPSSHTADAKTLLLYDQNLYLPKNDALFSKSGNYWLSTFTDFQWHWLNHSFFTFWHTWWPWSWHHQLLDTMALLTAMFSHFQTLIFFNKLNVSTKIYKKNCYKSYFLFYLIDRAHNASLLVISFERVMLFHKRFHNISQPFSNLLW